MINAPKESAEQSVLMRWAELQSGTIPELKLLFHIPNGGSRNALEARNLKAQGVKSGVPDLCLPVARRGYHALYVEMKRTKGGTISENQLKWIHDLRDQGNCVVVAYGFVDARAQILEYLGVGT